MRYRLGNVWIFLGRDVLYDGPELANERLQGFRRAADGQGNPQVVDDGVIRWDHTHGYEHVASLGGICGAC